MVAPSHPSPFAAPFVDDVLHVDHFGLSIGAVSVGLPHACTADEVLRRYLDLHRLVHRGEPGVIDHPDADVAVLADHTGYPAEVVRRRLSRLGGT